MTTGILHDQNLEKQIEKQMGCMAGFLQIFDRNQVLTGKRLYATKRLPPSTSQAVHSTPESEKSVESPSVSSESEKQQQASSLASPSPDRFKSSPAPAEAQSKSPLPLPIFGFKEGTRSSWKFSKEAPRLSLDSRATVDAKGSLYPREIRTNASILSANRCESSGDGAVADDNEKHRRSPSVIARLMGLEPLPHSGPEPIKKAELRRSASESRVSRDLLQYRSIDGTSVHQLKQPIQSNSGSNISSNVIENNTYASSVVVRSQDRMDQYGARPSKSEPLSKQRRLHQQRKSFFDSEDFFPEPKQTVSIYGEIEKRLKMRGIDEPSKDLETLKQILEALQLKGLLHSNKPPQQIGYANIVYDRSFSHDESPIVVMKPARSPARSPASINRSPASFRSKPVARRNLSLAGEGSPENDRSVRNQTRGRNSNSPTRNESSAKSSNSLVRRKALNVETQRKANDQCRVSPVHSPKLSSKRTGSDQTTSRSPRNKKPTAEIYPKKKIAIVAEDESSSISESSISTSSQTDTERLKVEDYKEGRNLLERCDKLLSSIAEITATELQPSPVSVLDSSFYKDESSPSPVMKRSIDFKDQPLELEDDIWSPAISPVQSKVEAKLDDCDFVYISEILRASDYLPEDSDVFLLLEKQRYLEGKDTSKVSRLQRKLIFDTVAEILDRNRQLPPWKAFSWTNSDIRKPSLQQIWLEFRKIQERDVTEDLFEIICGVLRKDLAGDAINGWGDSPLEMSEAVLDIERLIFKDLVGETIRDLAALTGKSRVPAPRRKLVF